MLPAFVPPPPPYPYLTAVRAFAPPDDLRIESLGRPPTCFGPRSYKPTPKDRIDATERNFIKPSASASAVKLESIPARETEWREELHSSKGNLHERHAFRHQGWQRRQGPCPVHNAARSSNRPIALSNANATPAWFRAADDTALWRLIPLVESIFDDSPAHPRPDRHHVLSRNHPDLTSTILSLISHGDRWLAPEAQTLVAARASRVGSCGTN